MSTVISAGTTTNTAYNVNADTSGSLVLATGSGPTTAVTIDSSQNTTLAGSLNAPNTFGFKNRIINGAMMIDQRNSGAAQTITTGTFPYTVDRWFASAAGANVTGQRVAGSGNNQNNYQFTGAASNTAISFTQRIESNNCYDLAGQTVTLSLNLANSLLTSVSYSIAYPTTTDNYAGATIITTGTFTVNSTLTNYSVQIAIPAAATTGLQISLSVGSQTTGTWTIGKVQLEKGSTATSFDYRPYGTELQLCQRYFYTCCLFNYGTNGYYQGYYGGSNALWNIRYPVQMRTTPTATISQPTQVQYYSQGGVWTNTTIQLASYNTGPNYNAGMTDLTVYVASDSSGGGKLIYLTGGATTTLPTIAISSEL